MSQTTDDPIAHARNAAFLQGLQELGWTVSRNAQLEYRWGPANVAQSRKFVADLIALSPDIIVATGGITAGLLLEVTRTVPVVFVQVTDPVGAGYVESLARPGGNATGFIPFEYGQSAKWLELLKEISPVLTRAAVLSRSNLRPRNRATCGDSIRCTVYGRRTAPDRSWRCCRDRARHCGNRSAAEQRCHSDREPFGNYPPQVNYKLGGSSTDCLRSIHTAFLPPMAV